MKSSRTWEAVVYPDSESYVAAESLAKATQYFGQWCYVLHDKDLNDDGTPKKPIIMFMVNWILLALRSLLQMLLVLAFLLFALFLLGVVLSVIRFISTTLINTSIRPMMLFQTLILLSFDR